MKIHYLISGLLIFLIVSCDPPRRCNEPKCLYTNINTTIKGTFSDTNSILNVNDTLFLTIEIPQTLNTNLGELTVHSMLNNGFFALDHNSFDSLTLQDFYINNQTVQVVYIDYDKTVNTPYRESSFDLNTRRFKCGFILNRIGKYKINTGQCRLDFKDREGKEWSTNVLIELDAPKRWNQFASWCSPDVVAKAYEEIYVAAKERCYWFEVQ